MILQVAYVGNRGMRLYSNVDANQISAAPIVPQFLTMQANVRNGCNPDGTGCPSGITGQSIPLVTSGIVSAAFVKYLPDPHRSKPKRCRKFRRPNRADHNGGPAPPQPAVRHCHILVECGRLELPQHADHAAKAVRFRTVVQLVLYILESDRQSVNRPCRNQQHAYGPRWRSYRFQQPSEQSWPCQLGPHSRMGHNLDLRIAIRQREKVDEQVAGAERTVG